MTSTPEKREKITRPEVIRSNKLFGERRELLISHCGITYRLRITGNNKLILTK